MTNSTRGLKFWWGRIYSKHPRKSDELSRTLTMESWNGTGLGPSYLGLPLCSTCVCVLMSRLSGESIFGREEQDP